MAHCLAAGRKLDGQERKISMTVGAVLKSKDGSIISVDPSATVLDIAEIITSRRIGAVLVLDDNGSVAGIVSERDVVKALAQHRSEVLSATCPWSTTAGCRASSVFATW
jgi:CBS domain-containing protein